MLFSALVKFARSGRCTLADSTVQWATKTANDLSDIYFERHEIMTEVTFTPLEPRVDGHQIVCFRVNKIHLPNVS